MKIAILSPWTVKNNSVGGTERFVIDLAESFANAGNNVDVYMLAGEDYEKNNVNYKSLDLFEGMKSVDEYFLKKKFDNFNSEKSFEDLAKSIEGKVNFEEYSMIQINSQLFLKVAENSKRIFTIHTNPFEYQLDWGKISFNIMLELMKKEKCNTDTYFVTPSMYYANIYREFTGIEIDFIPHAIDVTRLSTYKDKMTIYDEMGIDKNKKVILLPSRLEPIQKQPMLFMRAFAKQTDEIKSKYKIICTGADKQYEQFKQEILDFCNDNNIDILIDRFDQMADGYMAADIVMLPSKSESFGYSALEALSLGIVTVLNEIPTYMEIAAGAVNCYTFANTEESLYNVLNNILDKNLERKEQSDDWKSKYSINSFYKKYINKMYENNNEFRFTTLKESPEYIEEYVTCCKKEWSNYTGEEFDEKVKEQIERIITTGDEIITVVLMLKEEELVGFISLFVSDGKYHRELSPWFATFYIKEEYRKNGYSKILFQKLIDESERLGYDTVFFRSYIDNYYDKFFNAEVLEELDNKQKLYKISKRKDD